MTRIEPFRGLRYDATRVRGSDVAAPPYDVVDARQVAALLESSPYNIAHVESCPGDTDARYEAAAAALRAWQDAGVLQRDAAPVYYVYEQRFAVPASPGRTAVRRAFFTRMEIVPAEAGIVRPHEATMAAAKEDRLKLLRATHTNVSPIFAMYSDPDGSARAILDRVSAGSPVLEATDGRGDSHRLWVINDPASIDALTAIVAASPVTIADGHHRYQTAINYLAEREGAGLATADDRFVCTGLVAQDEPGLMVLPIHRLIRAAAVPSDLEARLEALWQLEDVGAATDAAAAAALWARATEAAATGQAFGAIGLRPGRLHLLTARDASAIDAAMPARLSPASRRLGVLVLNETILEPLLGLDAAARSAGAAVAFTEDVAEAWRAVDSGEFALALLVQPVHAPQVVEVAAAGELLPQKSTFFYPKMSTGMVLNPLD